LDRYLWAANSNGMKVSDLLWMSKGTEIPRGVLRQLVIDSKYKDHEFFEGEDWKLGNTPYQGIHWIEDAEGKVKAAVVKMYEVNDEDSYEDQFLTSDHDVVYYHFKAQRGNINKEERANRCLREQRKIGYPILVLDGQDGGDWIYRGRYELLLEDEAAVVLRRMRG